MLVSMQKKVGPLSSYDLGFFLYETVANNNAILS